MLNFGYGVQLGPLDSTYNDTIRNWRNDYNVWKWCRQNDLISDMDQEKWFQRQSNDPTIKMYVIQAPFENHGLHDVGVCGLTSIDLYNRRAEFSLYIATKHQKKGYAKRGLQTLIHHGFDNLGLNCVWGETFAGNPALDLFKRIGLKEEGIRRQFYFKEGQFVDCHLVSILKYDFEDTKRDFFWGENG